MSTQSRRFLDVWITESNTVYREVPFNVVTDWLQQGRLLADDQLRPSGTAQWVKVGETPTYAAYLPQMEPFQAEDQAEALEPVEMDLTWRHRPSDDDEDVDMIPLIDVSLVLLVFFMMTTTGVAAFMQIKTPDALYGDKRESTPLWIGIDKNADGDPVYSLGVHQKPAEPDDKDLKNLKDLLARLDGRLAERDGKTEVLVSANEDLPVVQVRRVQIELERRPVKISRKYLGVSDKRGSE